MTQHTNELWAARAYEDPLWLVHVVGEEFEAICITSQSNDEEHAKHIVACHNACIGMIDPEAEIAQPRQDKADLVEALNNMHCSSCGLRVGYPKHKERDCTGCNHARAAIAKHGKES